MATESKRLYPVLIGGTAGQGGKCGYIDAEGELVIPPRYDFGGSFSEGLAVVGNFDPDRREDPVTRGWRWRWSGWGTTRSGTST